MRHFRMGARPGGEDGRPPLQFGLRAMLLAVAMAAVVFSMLGWLGVPPEGQLIVLAILGLGAAAAVALLAAIAGGPGNGGDDEDV